jgi:hypothetical protein
MIAHPEKYRVYYDLLQRFATYGNSRVTNRRTWSTGNPMTLCSTLQRGAPHGHPHHLPRTWTAFLPSIDLMQSYIDNTVLLYYPAIDSVPRVTLYYILQTQLSGSLVLSPNLPTVTSMPLAMLPTGT